MDMEDTEEAQPVLARYARYAAYNLVTRSAASKKVPPASAILVVVDSNWLKA